MKKLLTAVVFIFIVQSITAQNTWVQKSDFGGTGRRGAVGFSIGLKGYIGTGNDGVNKKDFWEYDPSTDTWTQKADFGGTARQNAVGFSIGSKGYIGTGYDVDCRKDFWEYDPSANVWTRKSDLTGDARVYAVGFSINAKGYIGTGEGNGVPNILKDFWEYNPLTDSWTRKADFGNDPRFGAVGFSIGNKGYIGTGWSIATNVSPDLRKDFWEYDPASNSWQQKADFGGVSRYVAVGFSIGTKGYIGSGYDHYSFDHTTKDFWEYDPSINIWTQKADFANTPRDFAVGFSIGIRGYVGTGRGRTDLNDFWEYSLSGQIPSTATSLTSSLNPSTVGQSIIFTATVTATSGTPTGTVTFYDGTTNLGTGTISGNTVSITTVALTAGSHNITAVYDGNSSYTTSTSSALVQVVTIPIIATTISITSSLNPAMFGQSILFTATVNASSGTPTGTVTFFDGTTNLGTGTLSGNTATFSTSALSAGSHNITAVYGGNTNYATNTSTVLVQIVSPSATPTYSDWIWMTGDNTIDKTGAYGTKGTPALVNNPGSRQGAVSWNDALGNLWLFGGLGYDAVNNNLLNDLWKYNIASNQWTWVNGDATTSTAGKPGWYGTQGIASSANNPGPRYQAVAWKDTSGNLWLFGGTGYDANGGYGVLNDLWKYDPNTNQWTWVKGDNIKMQAGIYGVQGTPSSGNKPGARRSAVSWTDKSGNFWLFGGFGYVSNTNNVYALNDLWKYNPGTNQWTWIKGDNTGNNIGVYGILGTPATANKPSSKWNAVSWVDASGDLWLFGGMGLFASNLNGGYYNDLWKYNIATNQWTWVKGDNTVNGLGIYGTKGISSISNKPAARQNSITWTDVSGNLLLFGGGVLVAGNNDGFMNDLWKYDPTINQWTWMMGDNTPDNVGVYGVKGIAATTNKPGGRDGAISWKDPSGAVWIFGGRGHAAILSNHSDPYLNDLWKLGITTVQDTTTTTLTSSLNPSTVGLNITFTATVSSSSGTPKGTVTFFDGTTNLGTATLFGNTATFSTSALSAGSHNITAVYNGAGSFAISTSSVITQVLNVPPLAITTTSLTSSLNQSTVGQNITFIATVSSSSGTPTGTVTFFDGTTNLGTATLSGNTATFTTSVLTSGSHNITAVYNANANYSSSTSGILIQVVVVPIVSTTTSLTSSLNTSSVGQSITFAATVISSSGIPTGTVTFFDGTTNIGTGTLSGNTTTFTTSALNAGSHNITAVYDGNSSYTTSTSSVLVQVVTIPIVSTNTSVTSSLNPVTFGQSITFTATVNALSGTPTGTVTFYDGTINIGTVILAGNTATITTSGLAAGSHNITAVYNGNSNYSNSTSSVLNEIVNTTAPLSKIATATSITSSNNFSVARQNITFTATVTAASGTPTGTVTFFDGTKSIGSSAISGSSATYSTSALTIGWHTIIAKYNGDIDYMPSTSPGLPQTIYAITPAKLLHLYPNPIKDNIISFQMNMEAGRYNISVTDNLGQVLVTKIINHTGGSTMETIELNKNFSAGVYHLKVTGTGIILVRKVIKN